MGGGIDWRLVFLLVMLFGLAFVSLQYATIETVYTLDATINYEANVVRAGYLPAAGAFLGTVDSPSGRWFIFRNDHTLRVGRAYGFADPVGARVVGDYIFVAGNKYDGSGFVGTFTKDSFDCVDYREFSEPVYAAIPVPGDPGAIYVLTVQSDGIIVEEYNILPDGCITGGAGYFLSISDPLGDPFALAADENYVVVFRYDRDADEIVAYLFPSSLDDFLGSYTLDRVWRPGDSDYNSVYAFSLGDGKFVAMFPSRTLLLAYFSAEYNPDMGGGPGFPFAVVVRSADSPYFMGYFDGNYYYGVTRDGYLVVYNSMQYSGVPYPQYSLYYGPLVSGFYHVPDGFVTTDSPFPSLGATLSFDGSVSQIQFLAFTAVGHYPNLYPEAYVDAPVAGEELNARVVVYNNGEADANKDDVWVLVRIVQDGNVVFEDLLHAGTLPAGGSVELQVPPVTLDAGDYNMVVVVDPSDKIPELDETDNELTLSFTVEPRPTRPSGGVSTTRYHVTVAPEEQPSQPSQPVQPASPLGALASQPWLVLVLLLVVVYFLFVRKR